MGIVALAHLGVGDADVALKVGVVQAEERLAIRQAACALALDGRLARLERSAEQRGLVAPEEAVNGGRLVRELARQQRGHGVVLDGRDPEVLRGGARLR